MRKLHYPALLTWGNNHVGYDFLHEFIWKHRKGGRPISDDRTAIGQIKLDTRQLILGGLDLTLGF